MKKTSSNRHAAVLAICSTHAMRGTVITLAALLLALASCATSHFETVVEIAASKSPRQCSAPFAVRRLSDWAYRVDACDGTTYFRCSYQRKTMGRSQCCHPVPDEATATALLGATGDAAQTTCQDFID
jgi:hypothetical protein